MLFFAFFCWCAVEVPVFVTRVNESSWNILLYFVFFIKAKQNSKTSCSDDQALAPPSICRWLYIISPASDITPLPPRVPLSLSLFYVYVIAIFLFLLLFYCYFSFIAILVFVFSNFFIFFIFFLLRIVIFIFYCYFITILVFVYF